MDFDLMTLSPLAKRRMITGHITSLIGIEIDYVKGLSSELAYVICRTLKRLHAMNG